MTTSEHITEFETPARSAVALTVRASAAFATRTRIDLRARGGFVVATRSESGALDASHARSPFDDGTDALGPVLAFLEAAPDAIVITGPGGIIGRANHHAERLFGYGRSELVGCAFDTIVPRDTRDAPIAVRGRSVRDVHVRRMGEIVPCDGRRKDGTTVPIEIGTSTVETPMGRITIAIIRDVTRRRELEAELRFASTHDPLTGLYNRVHLDAARRELDASAEPIGVLVVDVDGLKAVNDRMGHEAGDRLLERCATVLRSIARPSVIVGRLGGDEFAVILPRADAHDLERAVRTLRSNLEHHNEATNGPRLELSIGAALAVTRGGMADAMQTADRRMYVEKRSRKLRVD